MRINEGSPDFSFRFPFFSPCFLSFSLALSICYCLSVFCASLFAMNFPPLSLSLPLFNIPVFVPLFILRSIAALCCVRRFLVLLFMLTVRTCVSLGTSFRFAISFFFSLFFSSLQSLIQTSFSHYHFLSLSSFKYLRFINNRASGASPRAR